MSVSSLDGEASSSSAGEGAGGGGGESAFFSFLLLLFPPFFPLPALLRANKLDTLSVPTTTILGCYIRRDIGRRKRAPTQRERPWVWWKKLGMWDLLRPPSEGGRCFSSPFFRALCAFLKKGGKEREVPSRPSLFRFMGSGWLRTFAQLQQCLLAVCSKGGGGAWLVS